MTAWAFSRTFRRADPERVARLESWESYDQILQASIDTSKIAPHSLQRAPRRHGDPAIMRTQFVLEVRDSAAVDALFNSAHGYRAQYLAGIEAGKAANRRIVHAIVRRFSAPLEHADPRHTCSLALSAAKVWMKQDQRQRQALRGALPHAPELDIATWMTRLDVVVPRVGREPAYLARAGVLAGEHTRTIEIIGAWMLPNGEEWLDEAKADRSEHIRDFGFS